jgi:CheY-like chemotaxis protein
MHALIIEDEYLIAQSLQEMLEDIGFDKFSFARSEDTAVAAAEGAALDLISADVRLLPGDGVQAVEAICKRRRIPVVFITGFAEELQERAPDATIVQKPVEPASLAEAVKRVLAQEKPSDDAAGPVPGIRQ